MLEKSPKNLYIYVVDRDFGFAPNPFHGYCTLATCKPGIRNVAQIGDWVMGVGGRRLNATGKCIYIMMVSEILSFNTYWTDIRFQLKKPLRSGSLLMMVGDNIYHQNAKKEDWTQEDSHHSNPDGTPNLKNFKTDTSSVNVLISNHFYYFGKAAPSVNLASIGYANGIGHRKKSFDDANIVTFVKNIEETYWKDRNFVIADPFDFEEAVKRVDQSTGKIA